MLCSIIIYMSTDPDGSYWSSSREFKFDHYSYKTDKNFTQESKKKIGKKKYY